MHVYNCEHVNYLIYSNFYLIWIDRFLSYHAFRNKDSESYFFLNKISQESNSLNLLHVKIDRFSS